MQRAVSTKASFPALEGILIKAYPDNTLRLSGYDLEIGIITEIEASVSQPGETVVSARLVSDIVRKLPEEIIEIYTDEKLITYIKSGYADYQIVGMSPDDYPDLPTFNARDELVINAGLLKNMIRQTIYAVSEVKDTPVYTGSYYEITENQLRIVAVDGFRMAIRTEAVKCSPVMPFVVPAKTQSEVLRLITDDEAEIKLEIGRRHIAYKVGNYSVISRLIEGTFINYQNTIPKESNTEFVIKTKRLLDAVDRMSIISNDKIKIPVRCKIEKDGIMLTCSTAVGKATDFIETPFTGNDVTIGFNYKFLSDALRYAETDEVKISIKGSLEPMTITPLNSDSFLFLVVPMRISF